MTMKKPGTVGMAAGSLALAGLLLFAAVRPSAADAPAGRFTSAAGTVTDTKTGLVWHQGVPSGTYTWADAGTYCTSNTAGLPGSGWRLPSLTELQTIVDDSRSLPAIDPTAFPSTPSVSFWTSSAYASQAGSAYGVSFAYGLTDVAAATLTRSVRCVR
jgi:hypothetical protein